MKKGFSAFQEQRMELFQKLVEKIWDGKLTKKELEEILTWLKEEYSFQGADLAFFKEQIRISMGLNPNQKEELSSEVAELKELSRVQKPVINKVEGLCRYCTGECEHACKYETLEYRRNKGPVIVNDKCLNCGKCISSCPFGALADKIEFMPLVDLLKDSSTPVYAAVAPAIAGQFGVEVSLGQLRTALKLLGFADLVEVALFADILTIKEAFEFNQLVREEGDFFLTSCCCPVWIRLVENKYPELFAQMSLSVSPMIAAGRILKELYPAAKVVFIGPCITKKAEAKDENLAGAIDFVLTFRELKAVFEALEIEPQHLAGDEKDQASFAARVYARTGGVSFAVKTVVNRIAPRRLIKFKSAKVEGVKECKQILERLSTEQEIEVNFIEGMGCQGGCVGGPRTNLEVEQATSLVNQFGEDSLIMTAFDNLNVIKILEQLGLEELEELLEEDLLLRK